MGNAESTQSADDTQMQVQQATDDEPWWNNIEHENLVLEQAPQAPTTAAKRTEEEEPPKNRKENRKTLVAVQMEEKANDSPEKEQSLEEFREELRNFSTGFGIPRTLCHHHKLVNKGPQMNSL